jgi:hypothetical protein
MAGSYELLDYEHRVAPLVNYLPLASSANDLIALASLIISSIFFNENCKRTPSLFWAHHHPISYLSRENKLEWFHEDLFRTCPFFLVSTTSS